MWRSSSSTAVGQGGGPGAQPAARGCVTVLAQYKWVGIGRTVIVEGDATHHGAPDRRMIYGDSLQAHERYFEELLDILASGAPPDHAATEALRARYDIEQLTPLRHA